MRNLSVVLAFLIAGCNSSTVGLGDISPTEVTVDEYSFLVRYNGTTAEAIRTGIAFAPTLDSVREEAAEALSIVTGCEVEPATLRGDGSVQFVDVQC